MNPDAPEKKLAPPESTTDSIQQEEVSENSSKEVLTPSDSKLDSPPFQNTIDHISQMHPRAMGWEKVTFLVKKCFMSIKPNIAIIISIVSAIISILSLLLAYVIYYESKTIAFKWEAHSQNDILVKLEQEWTNDAWADVADIEDLEDGKLIKTSFLPLWIRFEVTNTGRRTFSVANLILIIHRYNKKNPKGWKQLINFYDSVIINHKQTDNGIIGDEIRFPMVVEPGHSKVFYKKIKLGIPNQLYNTYQRLFKGKPFSLGETIMSDTVGLHISKYYYVRAEIDLAGGESKYTRVGIDEVLDKD